MSYFEVDSVSSRKDAIEHVMNNIVSNYNFINYFYPDSGIVLYNINSNNQRQYEWNTENKKENSKRVKQIYKLVKYIINDKNIVYIKIKTYYFDIYKTEDDKIVIKHKDGSNEQVFIFTLENYKSLMTMEEFIYRLIKKYYEKYCNIPKDDTEYLTNDGIKYKAKIDSLIEQQLTEAMRSLFMVHKNFNKVARNLNLNSQNVKRFPQQNNSMNGGRKHRLTKIRRTFLNKTKKAKKCYQ